MLSKYDRWKLASPPDYSSYYEEADEDFDRGYLEDEFIDAFEGILSDGLDAEDEEGDYERRAEAAEAAGQFAHSEGRSAWRAYSGALERSMPRTFDAAKERAIEQCAEGLIEDADICCGRR